MGRKTPPKGRKKTFFRPAKLTRAITCLREWTSNSNGSKTIRHQNKRCRRPSGQPKCVSGGCVGTPQRLCIKAVGLPQKIMHYPEYMSCVELKHSQGCTWGARALRGRVTWGLNTGLAVGCCMALQIPARGKDR
jgi:hypothetical protein